MNLWKIGCIVTAAFGGIMTLAWMAACDDRTDLNNEQDGLKAKLAVSDHVINEYESRFGSLYDIHKAEWENEAS